MRLTGRMDFAIRAAAELAGHEDFIRLEDIARAQELPTDYVRATMSDLRRAGIVDSRRGRDGGYRLALPPSQITLADIMRAVDGPLTAVRGARPETLEYEGAAAGLKEVWLAIRASERRILEAVTLEHLIRGQLPAEVASAT